MGVSNAPTAKGKEAARNLRQSSRQGSEVEAADTIRRARIASRKRSKSSDGKPARAAQGELSPVAEQRANERSCDSVEKAYDLG